MRTLGTLLNSAAKTEVLRALACQPGEVRLRQLSRIAGVHPHSAELALAALIRDGLVMRRLTSSSTLYKLIRDHEDAAVLDAVFAAAANGFIKARSRSLNERARSLLPFFRQATRMLDLARESRHGS
jgi:predicted ArsR family transcriptional regulator